MIFFKKYKPKSEFGFNFLTLLTGSGISQLIVLGASPILTRLFTPGDFGISALFISITSILLILGTGRYEMAIVQLRRGRWFISNYWNNSYFILFFLFSELILILFSDYSKLNELNVKLDGFLYLVPIYVFIVSFIKR